MSRDIDKNDVLQYLKASVEEAKNKKDKKLNIEKVKYYNTFTIYDKLFPFHNFFDSKDPIPYMNVNFLSTFSYMKYLRETFVNLLNSKFSKFLTEEEKQTLKKTEYKYFILNCSFYSVGMIFLLKRPIKFLKFLNFYIGIYLLFVSNSYSIFFLNKEFIELRNRILFNKVFMPENDVYDETMIPDWRCYLYYYKIL